MTTRDPDVAAGGRTGLRRGHLGAGHIAFIVVATVAPLAGVAGAAPVVFASNGAAAPATFILAGALFALFSVGYVVMSRHTTNAGGFVAYVARGLGTTPATAVAYVSVLAYLTFQVAMWSQFGVFTRGMVDSHLGIDLPAWVWSLLLLSLGTFIVSRGLDLSIRVAGVILALEVLVLVALFVFSAIHGDVGEAASKSFTPDVVFGPGLGVAFLFGVAAFVGFEATVVFSEEAKDPHRTVPRAIIIAIASIAILYTLGTLALSLSWGPDNVQAAAIADPVNLLLQPLHVELGGWVADYSDVLIVTSYLASLVGSMNMATRVVFSLGRAGVLPSVVGETSGGGTPRRATYAFAGAIVVIFLGFQLAGADPILVTFSWLLALGTVALLCIMLVTSFSIAVFFRRGGRQIARSEGLLRTLICPLLAFAGFVTALVLAITNYDALLGGTGSNARWLLLAIPVLAVAGALVGSRKAVSPDFAADLG